MAILRSDEYLITTWVGNARRRVKWSGHKSHDLDVPIGWVIEPSGINRLRIRNASLPTFNQQLQGAIEFDTPEPGGRQLVELPAPSQRHAHRRLDVEIIHLRPMDPVYLLRHARAPKYPENSLKQLTQFYGERYYLVRYRPVPASRRVEMASRPIFDYRKTRDGYTLVPLVSGLRIKTPTKNLTVPQGSQAEFSERDFFSATIIYGVHWWRYRMVPTPNSMAPIETEDSEEDIREELRFKYSAISFLFLFMVVFYSTYKLADRERPVPKVLETADIKLPKLVPPTKEELKPKPPPPPPPPPEPPPEPPKVVELKAEKTPKPPRAKPAPRKKEIVRVKPKAAKEPKMAKAKPKPMIKEPPATAPEPPPPPAKMAQSEPPANTGGAAAKKAQENDAMKQQLIKSLGFISTSSQRAAQKPVKYETKEGGRFTDKPNLVGGDISQTTALDKTIADAPGDGNIRTNSSRTVTSSVKFGKRKGKGLNDVQGKVSLGELYSGNGSKLGDSLGGGSGLSISGLGAVSEGEIEKALQKYMQRFQFCYEKALLSDSSLGGKIVMQWTVEVSGTAKSPKVVSSQLNNGGLHGCISKVISEIPFPSPKGGTVDVKKTFSFSSSSI